MCRVASQDEVKTLIIKQEDVGEFKDLWPAVKSGVIQKNGKREKRDFPYKRWAFSTVGILAVLLAGFLFYSVLFQNGILIEPEGEARFQINSIRVGDEPATPFIYQPKDSDMILVWAEKGM
jgi:hypothetical protein